MGLVSGLGSRVSRLGFKISDMSLWRDSKSLTAIVVTLLALVIASACNSGWTVSMVLESRLSTCEAAAFILVGNCASVVLMALSALSDQTGLHNAIEVEASTDGWCVASAMPISALAPTSLMKQRLILSICILKQLLMALTGSSLSYLAAAQLYANLSHRSERPHIGGNQSSSKLQEKAPEAKGKALPSQETQPYRPQRKKLETPSELFGMNTLPKHDDLRL